MRGVTAIVKNVTEDNLQKEMNNKLQKLMNDVVKSLNYDYR